MTYKNVVYERLLSDVRPYLEGVVRKLFRAAVFMENDLLVIYLAYPSYTHPLLCKLRQPTADKSPQRPL